MFWARDSHEAGECLHVSARVHDELWINVEPYSGRAALQAS